MSNKKILHLTLKREWFDLIASGAKKKEFRLMTTYWYKRLSNIDVPVDHPDRFLKFDEIHFRNGYRPDSPFMRVKHIKTDITPPKLITYPNGVKLHLKGSCYEIFLGDILEIKNYKP